MKSRRTAAIFITSEKLAIAPASFWRAAADASWIFRASEEHHPEGVRHAAGDRRILFCGDTLGGNENGSDEQQLVARQSGPRRDAQGRRDYGRHHCRAG